jgi:hypothetical protein
MTKTFVKPPKGKEQTHLYDINGQFVPRGDDGRFDITNRTMNLAALLGDNWTVEKEEVADPTPPPGMPQPAVPVNPVFPPAPGPMEPPPPPPPSDEGADQDKPKNKDKGK